MIPGIPPLKQVTDFSEGIIDRYSPNSLINRLRNNYWGIYQDKDGNSPFSDKYLTHEVSHTANVKVSTAPQEKGAFVSYSFTQNPNSVTVKVTKSGDKTKFLAECENMVKAETLYYVLTPDASYSSMKAQSMNVVRNLESLDLVEVDIEFIEVRIIDQTVIKKTTSPNAAKLIDYGQNEAKTIEALF